MGRNNEWFYIREVVVMYFTMWGEPANQINYFDLARSYGREQKSVIDVGIVSYDEQLIDAKL